MCRDSTALPRLTMTVINADFTVDPLGIVFCVSNLRSARWRLPTSSAPRVMSVVEKFVFAEAPPRTVAYTTCGADWFNVTVLSAAAPTAADIVTNTAHRNAALYDDLRRFEPQHRRASVMVFDVVSAEDGRADARPLSTNTPRTIGRNSRMKPPGKRIYWDTPPVRRQGSISSGANR